MDCNQSSLHLQSPTRFLHANLVARRKGTVPFIPSGWKQMFILSAGFGVLDGALAKIPFSN